MENIVVFTRKYACAFSACFISISLASCGVKPQLIEGGAAPEEKVEQARKECRWIEATKASRTPWSANPDELREYRRALVNLSVSYDCMRKRGISEYIGFQPWHLFGSIEAGRKNKAEGLAPSPEYQTL
jgi:hypothetical protein